MSKKILLQICCFLFVSLPFTKIFSQLKRSFEGHPFIFQQRTSPARTVEDMRPLLIRNPYRSYNGTNNNMGNQKTLWGATDIPLYRELPTEYGSSNPLSAMGGTARPSARTISNSVCDEPVTQFNSRNLSAFVYVWGQFLDHDLSLTPTGTTEYVPVTLPPDEPLFTEDIPFFRSEVFAGTGNTTTRQQSNITTAWIDASMVYGSDEVRAVWLRTLQRGKMKTSAGNFLPWNTVNLQQSGAIDPSAPGMGDDGDHTIKTVVTGDPRGAEHPGLTGLHTIFVREHNRICDRLYSQGFRNDEYMYQTARKEVGALIQAITYQEFLPAMGVTLSSYTFYNSNTRPDILNTFATAGYRIGHTMVADELALRDNICREVAPGALDLVDIFNHPQLLLTYGLEPFLKGFSTHKQYETDTKVNPVLRDFLFGNATDSIRFGIDLASLNIQRGRDHGLPNYNATRIYYTGVGAATFSDITANAELANKLKVLYGNTNNVDLWVGILAEDRLPGKSVGKTMHAMLKSQFEKIRNGDYYFYRNDPYLPIATRNQVIATKFSDVLKRNTSLTSLQPNVFFIAPCPGENGEDRSANTAIVGKISNDITSVEHINETAGINIYPNPVADILNVNLGSFDASCSIELLTSNGTVAKTIKSTGQKTLRIDISRLAKGIYIMNIIGSKERESFRFVKL